MKAAIIALLAGLLFGCGLIVSGMADPAKVSAFLDLTGLWDPSLALVMAGAVGFAAPGFTLARRRDHTLLGQSFHPPGKRGIDIRLVAGSVLFGIGWGLAGICPGPALVLLSAGSAGGAVFCAAMLAGMGLFHGLTHLNQ